jgi:hypothetical protein
MGAKQPNKGAHAREGRDDASQSRFLKRIRQKEDLVGLVSILPHFRVTQSQVEMN